MDKHLFNSNSYYPIDMDGLGKILTRTFAKHIGGLRDTEIVDDIFNKGINDFPGDALIYRQQRLLSCEIKTSRKMFNHFGDYYQFSKWRTSAKSRKLKIPYDRLFCVGLPPRGFGLCAPPNSPKALMCCDFFILPYSEIPGRNHFQPYFRTLHRKHFYKYYASGSDYHACRELWRHMWDERYPFNRPQLRQ